MKRKSLPLEGKVDWPQAKTDEVETFPVRPFSVARPKGSLPLAKSVVDTFLTHQKSIQKSVRWFPRQRTPRLKDPTAGP